MADLYPLATKGKIIGLPDQGTHSVAFNKAGGSNNWESENAIDISTPTGTPVVAVANGVIGQQIGSLGTGGRFAGLRVHLVTNDNEFYYAHLSKLTVTAGQQVTAGQVIGFSGEANGVQHLHIASKVDNPNTLFTNAPTAPSGDQDDTSPVQPAGSPPAPSQSVTAPSTTIAPGAPTPAAPPIPGGLSSTSEGTPGPPDPSTTLPQELSPGSGGAEDLWQQIGGMANLSSDTTAYMNSLLGG